MTNIKYIYIHLCIISVLLMRDAFHFVNYIISRWKNLIRFFFLSIKYQIKWKLRTHFFFLYPPHISKHELPVHFHSKSHHWHSSNVEKNCVWTIVRHRKTIRFSFISHSLSLCFNSNCHYYVKYKVLLADWADTKVKTKTTDDRIE